MAIKILGPGTIDSTVMPADEYIEPSDHGFKTWSHDPAAANASTILAAGTLNLVRLWVRSSQSISSVMVHIPTTAGATLTNVGFALYSAAGVLLTSSVNANGATTTAFQSVGPKTVTFTAQTVTGSFYVGFWTTGTTQPTLLRSSNLGTTVNVGLSAPNFRFATANTGLTTTAPGTLGTQTQSATSWWVAAS